MNYKDELVQLALAVRSGRFEQSEAQFVSVLSNAQDLELLSFIDGALLIALRSNSSELFISWLVKAEAPFYQLLERQADASAALLQKLAFAALDKRLTKAYGVLELVLRRYFHLHQHSEAAQSLWQELLNLVVRVVRRGWKEDTAWLYRLLLHVLLAEKDLNVVRSRLWQLQLHFTIYAKWDGIAGAAEVYRDLFYVYLLILRRSLAKDPALRERSLWLRVVVHSLRELTNNVSRILMMDDVEIFHIWHDLWSRQATGNSRLQRQFSLMLQLVIEYWRQTMPKTGRRQAKFLKELTKPDLVGCELKKLLASIC